MGAVTNTMPFPIAHGLLGASFYAASQNEISHKRDWRVLICSAGLAILPDVDFIFDWAFRIGGWHRGFTHSIAFGITLGLVTATFVGVRNLRNTIGLVLAAVSHGLFDAMVTSSNGSGVELFWPFLNFRYKFGWWDYFSFNFHPRFDPMADILSYILTVSLLEVIFFSPLLLVILFVNRRAGYAPPN
jgi:membrane-bound metal-dependent hydrolase YbcI (DUF457 family)